MRSEGQTRNTWRTDRVTRRTNRGHLKDRRRSERQTRDTWRTGRVTRRTDWGHLKDNRGSEGQTGDTWRTVEDTWKTDKGVKDKKGPHLKDKQGSPEGRRTRTVRVKWERHRLVRSTSATKIKHRMNFLVDVTRGSLRIVVDRGWWFPKLRVEVCRLKTFRVWEGNQRSRGPRHIRTSTTDPTKL